MRKLLMILLIGTISVSAFSQTNKKIAELPTQTDALSGTELVVIENDSTRQMTWADILDSIAVTGSFTINSTNIGGLTGLTGSGEMVFSVAPTLTGDAIAQGGMTIGNGGLTFDIDSVSTDGTSFLLYDGATQLAPDIPSGASDDLGDLSPLHTDTIEIPFVIGSKQTADTAVFNNNAIFGAFFNEATDTILVRTMRSVLGEGTGTETLDVQISWHATIFSGSATDLNTSAYTVTSITTGDLDTSFDNAKIPPGVWVWAEMSGVSAGNRPSFIAITLGASTIKGY